MHFTAFHTLPHILRRCFKESEQENISLPYSIPVFNITYTMSVHVVEIFLNVLFQAKNTALLLNIHKK